ncbi:nipped-B protein [Anopheles ziemanni]|uniref:nipped-B protein n=1 Tax=Anopheles coustani TaxID=139045 RepID=UPI002658716E|nr:nipped-B protein [Anopheles coustani]XP_058177219.1 nipped-B protein [Anopheles ziemanni]
MSDVPITTLAGLTSLSDLLSELPISDSLSVSASLNRSLLFHPRVAEEANNLLATRDDALTAQLVTAIEQTNSDTIELKDQYPQPSANGPANDGPSLLQAIHACRPNVFKSPYNSQLHQMFSSAVALGAGNQQQLVAQQQKLTPTSQTQFYNLPNESYTNSVQPQQTYTQQQQAPVEQLQSVFQNQHDIQHTQYHASQQAFQLVQQQQQQPQLLPQQTQLIQQQFLFTTDPNQSIPPSSQQTVIRQQQQPNVVAAFSASTLPTQDGSQTLVMGHLPIAGISQQQVINVQNVPYSSNPAEHNQLQQQQQQQLFQQQQQQQQQIQQQQQQQNNQNVIVSHSSAVVQSQHVQSLPSLVDSQQSVIQQSASFSSLNASGGPLTVSANNSQATMLQQNHLNPQQQHPNVINQTNNNIHSASTQQHQYQPEQQHLSNHTLIAQVQQTSQSQQQQQQVQQSHLNNGNPVVPLSMNHQSYQQPALQQQQQQSQQQQQFNMASNLAKLPETAPRNNEYLQQQQSKNLDARGRPSPAQGSTAPETVPVAPQQSPTSTSINLHHQAGTTAMKGPPQQAQTAGGHRYPMPLLTPNKPRPPGPGGGGGVNVGQAASTSPAVIRPIGVSGALISSAVVAAPNRPMGAAQTTMGPAVSAIKAPPTPPIDPKVLFRMVPISEVNSVKLCKLNVCLDRLTDKQLSLLQTDLKQFVNDEPKLAVRMGLVKKSYDQIFTKMKEETRGTGWWSNKRKALDRAEENPEDYLSKPKVRRVERPMMAPVVKKLSKEELMATSTYQRFVALMNKIFDQLDETEAPSADDGDGEQYECIPTGLLNSVSSEAAKLKVRNAIDAIPENKLTLLISYAMRSVHSAKNLNGCELQDDMVGDECFEKILNAVEASLLICCLYTSKSTKFLQEDNIDAIIKFVQFQLRETLFPSYDPVYSVETKRKGGGDGKRKKAVTYQQKGISTLYSKIVELSKQLVTMFEQFHFVDTIVIHASSLGVEPFFVDNIETLQFVCLDLVTTIFQNEKYAHHRRNIVSDILTSFDRLPHSKRNLRPYKLVNNGGNIQMMTALVLQLIQSSVILPDTLGVDGSAGGKQRANNNSANPADPSQQPGGGGGGAKSTDLFIFGKYNTALSIGGNFLTTFLDKCKSRSNETDFRPLFENFIHDLLTTVNKPEWPAAELLLSLLGTMLVKKMSDKSVEQSIRVVSLEYLGIVAARLRKDTVESRCKVKTMDTLIRYIKIEQEKEGDEPLSNSKFQLDEEEERTEFLQKILLDFLAVNAHEGNVVWNHARHFYITQWYRDLMQRKKKIAEGEKGYASRKKAASLKKRKKYASDSEGSDGGGDDSDGGGDDTNRELREGQVDQELNSEIFRMLDTRKQYYLSQVAPFQRHGGGARMGAGGAGSYEIKTYIDYSNANLIAQYLASKRSFSQSYDKYLQKIILVVREPVVAIRTRAMKCLANIVEVDQLVLARKDMQMGVQQKLLDTAISVREAAVDLVGKYILSDPDLIDQYYEMISQRILDTGVSVRKRVIKILRDICMEYPAHEKIPDICVKMIRRVNDEEGIQKLVMDVFMTMWFTPCNDNDKAAMLRKITQIIDVVCSSHETGTQGFDALLKTIFEPKENKEDSKMKKEIPKTLIKACQQIVDGLVEATLRLEGAENPRLVGCITALHLFAKIQPQLLVNHAITLEPYLNMRCQNSIISKFISSIAEILEQVVPLMDHPSEVFLADLESHLMMLIVTQSRTIVLSCVSCLSTVVNKITKNYKLIRDCFSKLYYKGLVCIKEKLTSSKNSIPIEQFFRPQFRRSIFTVGLIMRYFDFKLPEVYGAQDSSQDAGSQGSTLPANICEDVFDTLAFFLSCAHSEICKEALTSMGNFCVKNYEYLMKAELRDYYNYLLTQDTVLTNMKITVLKNILMYLTEEENKMVRNDKEWSKQSQTEDLKEMGDVSSGMASRVIQIYLKEILRSFLHRDSGVRMWAMRVIEIVLRQGLVHPVQIVPYLICLSTDPEKEVAHSADRHLQEIDKQYPGFVNMKSHAGMQLSYELQELLQRRDEASLVRGYRVRDPQEPPSAMNSFLYTLLRGTKPQRRALIQSITKQFDDGKISLRQMLYLADNLAYFPYVVQDEPLYIIHHVDVLISVTGTNLLASFREGLKPLPGAESNTVQAPNPLEDDDDDDQEAILNRLPEDTSDLDNCIRSAQGCMLLLILKQHLKDIYGITDSKISRYSPSETGKIYDKAMQRRTNSMFDPKATITLLKENRTTGDAKTDQDRVELVQRYLDFKQLMLKLDPDDPDLLDDDEKPNSAAGTPVKQNPAASGNMPSQDVTKVAAQYNHTADGTSNNVHVNNVNVASVPATQQNDVTNRPSAAYLGVGSVTPKTPKSTSNRQASTGARRSAAVPTRGTKKKKRKLSSSEEDDSDASEGDYD